MGGEGARVLDKSLGRDCTLLAPDLSLSSKCINAQGFARLVESIAHNTAPTELDLDKNRVGKMLAVNFTLVCLSMCYGDENRI